MQDVLSLYEQAKKLIEEKGFAVVAAQMNVEPDPLNDCVHTLGLAAQGLPELVVFGMTDDLGSSVLATLANIQINQGPFIQGRVVKDEMFKEGSPYAFMMIEVEPCYIDDVFFMNKVLYGENFKTTAIQVCYQDINGRYPWDPGSDLAETHKLGRQPNEEGSEA